jgi:hypothetical protein
MSDYWLSHNSPYFKDVPINNDQDREELALRIKSACEFIERYCNRQFALNSYSGVYTVRQDGSLILDNPPIQSIDRIMYSNGGWLYLANTTDYDPSYSTGLPPSNSLTNMIPSLGFITLTETINGVRNTLTYNYSDYPTLGQLATQINADAATNHTGWVATVPYAYLMYPSEDLVAYQYSGCGTQTMVLSWISYNALLCPNVWPTRGYYLQYEVSSGILDWYFPRGMRLRCDYTAGFDPVPEPIKLVTAKLVLESSRKKSETLGDYSYSYDDIESLPASDKRLLGRYLDRRC